MMMQPPKRFTEKQIPAREYIFIVDVSGSMNGFPLEVSKKLLRDLIGNLRPVDKFNVLLFAGGSNALSEKSLAATPENIKRAIHVIDNEHGAGGTQILPALNRALALPREEGISRTVIIATDGYVHVEKEAFDIIRNNLNKANMFAFGIGSGVNRYLIEGMAKAGMGESFVVINQSEAVGKAAKFRKYIESPLLTQINVEYEDFDVYDVEPVSIPDVMAQRPVIVFGKWRGNPKGKIRLHGYAGGGEKYISTADVSSVKPLNSNLALKYLWARKRIEILADYQKLVNDNQTETITSLGLKYNLLTSHT